MPKRDRFRVVESGDRQWDVYLLPVKRKRPDLKGRYYFTIAEQPEDAKSKWRVTQQRLTLPPKQIDHLGVIYQNGRCPDFDAALQQAFHMACDRHAFFGGVARAKKAGTWVSAKERKARRQRYKDQRYAKPV